MQNGSCRFVAHWSEKNVDEQASNPFYTLIIAVKIRTFIKVKFVRVFLQNCVYFFSLQYPQPLLELLSHEPITTNHRLCFYSYFGFL